MSWLVGSRQRRTHGAQATRSMARRPRPAEMEVGKRRMRSVDGGGFNPLPRPSRLITGCRGREGLAISIPPADSLGLSLRSLLRARRPHSSLANESVQGRHCRRTLVQARQAQPPKKTSTVALSLFSCNISLRGKLVHRRLKTVLARPYEHRTARLPLAASVLGV